MKQKLGKFQDLVPLSDSPAAFYVLTLSDSNSLIASKSAVEILLVTEPATKQNVYNKLFSESNLTGFHSNCYWEIIDFSM